MNLERMRLCRQGAAGILPAVFSSDLSAGKMPAAPSGSWNARVILDEKSPRHNKIFSFQVANEAYWRGDETVPPAASPGWASLFWLA